MWISLGSLGYKTFFTISLFLVGPNFLKLSPSELITSMLRLCLSLFTYKMGIRIIIYLAELWGLTVGTLKSLEERHNRNAKYYYDTKLPNLQADPIPGFNLKLIWKTEMKCELSRFLCWMGYLAMLLRHWQKSDFTYEILLQTPPSLNEDNPECVILWFY